MCMSYTYHTCFSFNRVTHAKCVIRKLYFASDGYSTYMYVYIWPEAYSVLCLAFFCLRFTCTFVYTCTCAYMHSRSPKTYHSLCIHVHVYSNFYIILYI